MSCVWGMGRSPCCEKAHTNKGAWTKEEDDRLIAYIRAHGEGCWRSLPKAAGLLRCGKSCRLRWANHLRPNLKKGSFSPEEERLILELHAKLGNKWARMAAQVFFLPSSPPPPNFLLSKTCLACWVLLFFVYCSYLEGQIMKSRTTGTRGSSDGNEQGCRSTRPKYSGRQHSTTTNAIPPIPLPPPSHSPPPRLSQFPPSHFKNRISTPPSLPSTPSASLLPCLPCSPATTTNFSPRPPSTTVSSNSPIMRLPLLPLFRSPSLPHSRLRPHLCSLTIFIPNSFLRICSNRAINSARLISISILQFCNPQHSMVMGSCLLPLSP